MKRWKRRIGAQPGNRNAWKHGLYSRRLSPEEIERLQQAASLQGLDAEIAILRLKLSDLLERDPRNLDIVLKAVTVLARLLRFKRRSAPQQSKDLNQAVSNALREIALPLGLKFVRK